MNFDCGKNRTRGSGTRARARAIRSTGLRTLFVRLNSVRSCPLHTISMGCLRIENPSTKSKSRKTNDRCFSRVTRKRVNTSYYINTSNRKKKVEVKNEINKRVQRHSFNSFLNKSTLIFERLGSNTGESKKKKKK